MVEKTDAQCGAGLAGTCYLITADPGAAGASQLQKEDGKLTLDSTGLRQWDRNNDGDYADSGENSWGKR